MTIARNPEEMAELTRGIAEALRENLSVDEVGIVAAGALRLMMFEYELDKTMTLDQLGEFFSRRAVEAGVCTMTAA